MITTYEAAPGIDVLTTNFPVPGLGLVPINAFVLHGSEPVLVDTGTVLQSEEFMTALRSVIDPSDLRWIWLTHTDPDHIGSLHQLLAENPRLTVITTFLGVGIMGLSAPLPMDRVHLVNPGRASRLSRPHADGFHAARLRQSGDDRLLRRQVRRPVQRRLLRCAPGGRPADRRRTSPRKSSVRARCSG